MSFSSFSRSCFHVLPRLFVINMVLLVLFSCLTSGAMLLNESFESGSTVSPNKWGSLNSGNISINSTNPLNGSYSGWDKGSSWGEGYVNFTNVTTGNITLSFKYRNYASSEGFVIGKQVVGDAQIYDQAFMLLCDYPTAGFWGICYGAVCTYQATNLSCSGTNNMTAIIYNISTSPKMDLYVNGSGSDQNPISPRIDGGAFTSLGVFGSLARLATGFGMFDDICICEGTFNSSCCGASPPIASSSDVMFLNQSPADLTSTNIWTYKNLTANFNYTNTTGISNVYINFSLSSSNRSCISSINGTCSVQNNTYTLQNGTNSSSADNQTVYTYVLDENNVLPTNDPINRTAFNQTHSSYNLTSNSDVIRQYFKNFSNSNYSIYESYITGFCDLYYCNSSYSSGNPSTSNACAQFYTGNVSFNHTANSFSNHSVFILGVNATSGKLGAVTITSDSYILTKGVSANTCRVYYVGNVSGANYSQYSTTTGTSYLNLSGTFNAHLHQFGSSDTLKYYGCQNKTGTIICSNLTTDAIGLDSLPPSAPSINSPNESQYVNHTLNISYGASFSPSGESVYYNISLLNPDLSFNSTIQGNNSNNLSYFWDAYSYNMTVGTWFLRVSSVDSSGRTTPSIRTFYVNRNAQLNITARTKNGNASISNFWGWAYDNTHSENFTFNVTTGIYTVDVTRGDYTIQVQSTNYSITNNSINQTINVSHLNVTVYLWETNTFNITFRDYYNLSVITGVNISLDLISDIFSNNYTTDNGTLYITLLLPTNYTMRYRATDYTERFYFFELTNESYNSLDLYMILKNASSNITVLVIDQNVNPVEGAYVKALKYDLDSNTYLLQEVGQTNNIGTVILTLTKFNEYYKFMVEYQDQLRVTTAPAYITSDSLTIQINLVSSVVEDYFAFADISATLVYNTGTNTFRLDYDDADGITEQVCLKTFLTAPLGETLLNTSCLTTASCRLLGKRKR